METAKSKSFISFAIILLFSISTAFSNSNNKFKSISETDEDEFVQKLIYPNPASDFMYLSADVEKIEIFDISGNLINSFNNDNEVGKISISNFNTGFYVVKIFSKSGKIYLHKMAFVK